MQQESTSARSGAIAANGIIWAGCELSMKLAAWSTN